MLCWRPLPDAHAFPFERTSAGLTVVFAVFCPQTLSRPSPPRFGASFLTSPAVLVLKDSIDKKSSRSFLGLVFATTFNVRGTKMTVYIFRSGFLRHTAGPFIQDVAYFNAGRTTTDRSKSPLVVVTFAAA